MMQGFLPAGYVLDKDGNNNCMKQANVEWEKQRDAAVAGALGSPAPQVRGNFTPQETQKDHI